jgi:8-oxo-dGTP pyrophosphatase MutT (NUDIX family)
MLKREQPQKIKINPETNCQIHPIRMKQLTLDPFVRKEDLLYIYQTNKFGDKIYIEHDTITNKKMKQSFSETSELPKDEGYWSIIHPSENIIRHYPHCEVRNYDGKRYLLSTEASENLTRNKNNIGACGILSFVYHCKRYFILTIDNKPYVQNPQGAGKENELPIDCLKRELEEELKVKVSDEQCKEIGYWKFSSHNELVGSTFYTKTHLYFVDVRFDQIEHLFSDRIKPSWKFYLPDISIVDVREYKYELDETKYVIFTSVLNVKRYQDVVSWLEGDKIISYKWSGHHREVLLSILGES